MPTTHVTERIHPICTQPKPYIPHMICKMLLVFPVKVPPLRRVSRMSELSISLKLFGLPSQQFYIFFVCKQSIQPRDYRKLPYHLGGGVLSSYASPLLQHRAYTGIPCKKNMHPSLHTHCDTICNCLDMHVFSVLSVPTGK